MTYASKYTDVNLPLPPVDKNQILQTPEVKPIEFVSGCDKFIPIPDPYQFCYLDATTKIDISSIPEFSNVNFVSDGTQTLTFSQQMQKRQVPGSWGAWASPPYTESSTPPILFSNYLNQVTIDLSVPSKVFGFELEPNIIGLAVNVDVKFYSGTELLGTISRTLINSSWDNPGARLFAAAYSCTPFDKVEITIDDPNIYGFAIAQLRYGDGIDCNLFCTSRYIPFECTIDTGFNVLQIGKPNFLGYNIDVDCEVSECYAKPKIKACHKVLDCDLPCVPVDILYIKGQAKLLLTIATFLDVEYPGPQIANFTCTPDIDICQTCLECLGEGNCDSGALVLKRIYAYISANNEVTIKGIMKFVCPYDNSANVENMKEDIE